TQATGFQTSSPNLCADSLVISQVYGGGGFNPSADYTHDFVELHNRGATPIDLDAMSIQYRPAPPVAWEKLNLSGSVPAGGYFFIELEAGDIETNELPTAGLSGDIDLD